METRYFSRKSSRQLFHHVIFKEKITQIVEDRVAVVDLDALDLVSATADHGARARVDALARKVLQEVVWLLLAYGLDLVRVDQDWQVAQLKQLSCASLSTSSSRMGPKSIVPSGRKP